MHSAVAAAYMYVYIDRYVSLGCLMYRSCRDMPLADIVVLRAFSSCERPVILLCDFCELSSMSMAGSADAPLTGSAEAAWLEPKFEHAAAMRCT